MDKEQAPFVMKMNKRKKKSSEQPSIVVKVNGQTVGDRQKL